MSLYLSFRHRVSQAGGHSACKTYGAVRRGHSSKREHVSPLIGSGPSGIVSPEARPGCDSTGITLVAHTLSSILSRSLLNSAGRRSGPSHDVPASPLTPSLFDGDTPEPTPPAWSMGEKWRHNARLASEAPLTKQTYYR